MRLTLKNTKLSILALIFITLFVSLGNWQLTRAKEKASLLASFAMRTQQPAQTAAALNQAGDLRFYQATLTGRFDNQHTLLLDNKTFEGQVGYEVYTPFKAKGLKYAILVDRGFIPLGASRRDLPLIKPISGEHTLTGMLNVPPRYVALGKITESAKLSWPLRIPYVNLTDISPLIGLNLHPYVLQLKAHLPGAYAIKWQIAIMPPEKHQAYAIQWFALALTLLILFASLGIKLDP